MDLLPDELLLMLMRTVADQPHWGVPSVLTLSEVSRKFFRVARDPVLWRFLVDRDCSPKQLDGKKEDKQADPGDLIELRPGPSQRRDHPPSPPTKAHSGWSRYLKEA